MRFLGGTLMSYRRHAASEDVLNDPGELDITADGNFTALVACGEECGKPADRLETLAQTLIAHREEEFARILAAPDAAEELKRRLQRKTILFGMGGSFRTLWQPQDGREIGGKSP